MLEDLPKTVSFDPDLPTPAKLLYSLCITHDMGEVAACGFESLAVLGIIIGSVVASIAFASFKDNKAGKEIKESMTRI